MTLQLAKSCLAATLAALLTPLAVAQAAPPVLPDGWERPTDADLAGPNLQFRQGKPGRYLVAEGDFNGDGVADRAEIAVNRFALTFAVYAFISKSAAPIELTDGRIKDVERMGVSTAKPGRTKTACGKDPDCKRGRPFVDIPFHSIELFGFDSGASQFYWTGEKFDRIWTSD